MRSWSVVVAVVLGAIGVVAPTGPSDRVAAAPNDIVAVVVEGTGFGHGRGMSQWGAYGWAVDRAKSWTWILDHYYGGTVMSDVPAGGRIRVRLSSLDNLGTVGVVSHATGGVRWNGAARASMYAVETSPNIWSVYGSTSRACPGATGLTVPNGPIARGSGDDNGVRQIQRFLQVHHNGAIVVDGDFGPQTETILRSWQTARGLPADGIWNSDDATRARQIIGASGGSVSWTKLGSAAGPIVFTTPDGETSGSDAKLALGVCGPGGTVTHYRGRVDVLHTTDGNRVVNDVKVEDYLRGVVPKEISASWADAGSGKGREAVRAQAVAARSYGLQQNRYSYARTCDTQACQVYFGAASRQSAAGVARYVEDIRTDQAIAATANKVRRWPTGHPLSGQIVSTEFSASNGPRTAGGAFPPVDDTLGDSTAKNPNHRWTRILDADTLAAQYGLGSLTGASMTDAAAGNYRAFDGIWFNDLVLTGSNGGTFRQQAWDVRRTHDFPSPGFTVRVIRQDTVASDLALIGDSVGNSIAGSPSSELRTLLDGTVPTLRVDTLDSRFVTKTPPSPSGVGAANALPSGLDLVVVELGYNPSTNMAADIDAMMNALRARNVRRVAWVNMADLRVGPGGTSYYAAANAALRAATSRWTNLTILDWNAASTVPERPRWFVDGVHLTTTGQAQFALWLRSQILSLSPSHWLSPPEIIRVPVVGEQLVAPDGTVTEVPAGAAAVSMNVTVVDPVRQGFATVWPCGVPRPNASSVNYPGGTRVANGVIAPVGTDGSVCLYSHRGTDVVVDVSGWFPQGTVAGVTPERLVDTRDGTGGRTGRITPSTPMKIEVTGAAVTRPDGSATTVPADVGAVAINLLAIDPTDRGFLAAWPCDRPRPTASNVNFAPGQRVANGAVVPVAADGTICVYAHEPTDLVVDLTGWFPKTAGAFAPVTPSRIADTRDGTGVRRGRVTPGAPLVVKARGASVSVGGAAVAIPADATALAVNLTVVGPRGRGFATVWPCGRARPDASTLNFVPGARVANNLIAGIGTDGNICVYTHADADVVVDVAGWFTGTATFVPSTPDRLVDTRIALGPAPS
jgi:peptidoglycan hydrolase-like protein with peptidoglycan-binding domain